ncbi:MAG: lactate utilization protein C, partial [Bacteroides sp.]|nr:lactate utilization protein C [Bacteroides sp.]
IVIVDTKQLVPHYEDVWEKLRMFGEVPRAINFITGPSKTADVEQTLQIGAHGPRNLHVVLVSDLGIDGPCADSA